MSFDANRPPFEKWMLKNVETAPGSRAEKATLLNRATPFQVGSSAPRSDGEFLAGQEVCSYPGSSKRRRLDGNYAHYREVNMKRLALVFALLPALAPGRAAAVDGNSVFIGPDITIAEGVGGDFPRYDIPVLCRKAWPGVGRAAEAARGVCVARQERIAAFASHLWGDIPSAAKAKCVRRSDLAGVGAYNVLYACVNAAVFTAGTQETVNRITTMVRAQNGLPPADRQAVGSIR